MNIFPKILDNVQKSVVNSLLFFTFLVHPEGTSTFHWCMVGSTFNIASRTSNTSPLNTFRLSPTVFLALRESTCIGRDPEYHPIDVIEEDIGIPTERTTSFSPPPNLHIPGSSFLTPQSSPKSGSKNSNPVFTGPLPDESYWTTFSDSDMAVEGDQGWLVWK